MCNVRVKDGYSIKDCINSTELKIEKAENLTSFSNRKQYVVLYF